jgi:hypothetical protein
VLPPDCFIEVDYEAPAQALPETAVQQRAPVG